MTEKYKKVDDFVKNTIVAAKEELDRVSPYSIEYALTSAKSAEVNKNRKGRPSITSVTFFPKRNVNNEPADALRTMVGPASILARDIMSLLKNKFAFDSKGINANISLFDIAQKNFDLYEFLQKIAPNALHADNVQGYVINSIKKVLKDKYGVVVEGQIILKGKSPLEPKTPKSSKNEPLSLKDILSGV